MATCFGVTWNETVNVCSGNGVCVGQDVCQCSPLFGGDNCEYPKATFGLSKELPGKTCYDIMIMNNYTLPSGDFYWIQPGNSAPFRVYCDMTTEGGGWTLIESFAYSNQTPQAAPFRDFGYNITYVNNDLPIDWNYYRLDLGRLTDLRASTQRWRATCNAHQGVQNIMNRDYVVVRHATFDMMTPGSGCRNVYSINVRGVACTGCLVYMAQGVSAPFRDHLYIGSSTYCGSGSISNSGAISGENNWGNYINPNGNFGCSSSLTATTNWWVKPDCWCANGGTCTAIGGYPCLCKFPASNGPNCMQPSTCNGVQWNATNVCSGNGKCVEQDQCSCDPNYGGDNCELKDVYGTNKEWPGKTCLDIMIMNASLPSGGFYWVKPGAQPAFKVFCDMKTEGGGWTLIESFSYQNNTVQAAPFRDFAFDSPVNQDNPYKWDYYRLSNARMTDLQSGISRWRATCNAHLDVNAVMNKDYVIVRQATRDFLTPFSGCSSVYSINVRGIKCTNCLVSLNQGSISPYKNHLYINSNTYCGTGSISNVGSVSGETDFGYYTNPNGALSCSASPTSTTNFWVKPDCYCFNGGTCTAIGGYPCLCPHPYT
jgi:hypothetical protein